MKKRISALSLIISALLAASACSGGPASETEKQTAGEISQEQSPEVSQEVSQEIPQETPPDTPDSEDKPSEVQQAPAASDFTPENDLSALPANEVFEYEAYGDGIKITGLKQCFTSVKYAVPDAIDGKPVTAIGEYCFASNEKQYIVEMAVTLPDSVTEIDRFAFNGSNSILYEADPYLEINFPKNLEKIGDYAFADTDMETAYLPDSVTEIGVYAFAGCSSLKAVSLGSISVLHDNCFADCESLTDVRFPDTLTEIEDRAFAKCGKLSAVDIPASVTVFGSNVFKDTPLLNTQPLIINDILIDWSAAARDVTVPDSVKAMANGAFHGNKSITSVTIPDSVTDLGIDIFALCKSLESVNLPSNITEIPDLTFNYCEKLKSIDIPNGVTRIGRAFKDSGLERITIPPTVTEIEGTAFEDTPFMENSEQPLIINGILVNWEKAQGDITIPDGVKSVSSDAFYYCETVTSVSFAPSVEKICPYAFKSCSILKSVNVPDTVKEIGYRAFAGCESLTDVSLPDGIVSGGDLFYSTPLEENE